VNRGRGQPRSTRQLPFGRPGAPACVPDEAAARLKALAASLAEMLGQPDHETARHTERVVELVGRMADRMQFDPVRVDALLWGARLHDIGKLAVPSEILHKRSRLDAQEWRVMQAHVEAGEAIAGSLDGLPQTALRVLSQHHERWDGSGYPAGLAGEEICLEARMFAFCDVYDALTHVRSYKPAWTHTQAINEIVRQTGCLFDPSLLAIFLFAASESS
jgi:HD-GYP domain-containing protein (c-di-GMP phosphodiesterase class II)